MFRCLICQFEAVLDDAIAITERGTCICLRCFARETGSERPVSRELRAAVERVLTA